MEQSQTSSPEPKTPKIEHENSQEIVQNIIHDVVHEIVPSHQLGKQRNQNDSWTFFFSSKWNVQFDLISLRIFCRIFIPEKSREKFVLLSKKKFVKSKCQLSKSKQTLCFDRIFEQNKKSKLFFFQTEWPKSSKKKSCKPKNLSS